VIMIPWKNQARAIRYRQLALGEPDGAKAETLYKLADEAERNVLCTPDWMRERLRGPSFINRAGDS
jgi:hypothetical protein